MYLEELQEAQKQLFLDLCIIISNSDTEFSYQEKRMIQHICREMDIPEKYDTESVLEEVIKQLAENSTEREKRIIIIEAAGIIMADNKYVAEEKNIVLLLSEAFGISMEEIENMIEIIGELYAVYKKFADFLTGKKSKGK